MIIKNKLKKIINLGIIFTSFILGYSLLQNIYQTSQASERLEIAYQKLENAKSKKIDLQQQLQEVKSNQYLETQARDKLGLAKKGEIVLVLPDDDILRKLSPRKIKEDQAKLPSPNWKLWLELFI